MKSHGFARRLLCEYGMVGILIALCAFFTLATIREETLTGARAARAVLGMLKEDHRVVVVAKPGSEGDEFAETVSAAPPGGPPIV